MNWIVRSSSIIFNISNFYLLTLRPFFFCNLLKRKKGTPQTFFFLVSSLWFCPYIGLFSHPTGFLASDIICLVSSEWLEPFDLFFWNLLKRKKGRFRHYLFRFIRVSTSRHWSSWILCNIVFRLEEIPIMFFSN